MSRIAFVSVVLAAAGVISAYATDLVTIIQKVSENCGKIQSFDAKVQMRYKICPNWYDRIGRYNYKKPDSTKLMLIDSVKGTDTAWSAFSSTSCSFSMVPSVMSMPIMSAKMVGAWAESAAVVIRDTLDTCTVKVPHNADTILYSIDMARGVIVGLYLYGPSGYVTHQYFYGFDKGVYYLRQVSCASWDTTIQNGGYIFKNVQINGEPVSSVLNRFRHERSRFAIRPIVSEGDRISFTGAEAGMRITAFDLFGRTVFETTLRGKGEVLNADRLCGGARCPSSPLLFRINAAGGMVSFPTAVIR
jgi:phosphoribulokinase